MSLRGGDTFEVAEQERVAPEGGTRGVRGSTAASPATGAARAERDSLERALRAGVLRERAERGRERELWRSVSPVAACLSPRELEFLPLTPTAACDCEAKMLASYPNHEFVFFID